MKVVPLCVKERFTVSAKSPDSTGMPVILPTHFVPSMTLLMLSHSGLPESHRLSMLLVMLDIEFGEKSISALYSLYSAAVPG